MNKNNNILIKPAAVSETISEGVKSEKITLRSLEVGLTNLGIIQPNQDLIEYQDINKWERGGGETYISDFKIKLQVENTTKEYHIIAKAILSFVDVDLRWEQYKNRIERLNSYEIPTPTIHSYYKGVIYQQFVEYSLQDYFLLYKDSLKDRLMKTARRIDQAGFNVVGLIHNLRTDGNIIYLTDFGEDLGEYKDAKIAHLNGKAENFAQKWLSKFEIN